MTLSSLFVRAPEASGAFRRGCALAAVLIAALAFGAGVRAQNADPVVARVNGVEIKASDLAIVEEDVGGNLPQMSPEAKRDYLITFMADMILVAKAAETRKISDGDDFKQRLSFLRTKLLMEQFLQAEAKNAVTEEAMRKTYDEAIKQIKTETEVRARHILVETEDEAKAILAELKKGGDFAELAKSKSKDPGSADGGDLGYFTKDQMVPEFAEVAFKTAPGQLSDPVKSQFGWHVIKVEDKRDRQPPEFDKVKDQLSTYLVRKAQAELITKLRADGKIERLDQPTPATPPAATPPAEQKKN
jgi:peptidyl-prolyl cis-trans isomerase C